MTSYYNEHDPFAAAWLRELIKAGHIAAGEVDERSIEDVRPSDLRGYTQCHFFAGIGVWSYALRKAGWPDDRPVWTGSCPCQPFSTAGKRKGTADERHLWPALFHLIRECKPATFFGEQVASKDGQAWFDTVQADLEGSQYTVGATDLCAAGFGAPHIRQRIYFVANNNNQGLEGRRGAKECSAEVSVRQSGSVSGLGYTDSEREHALLFGQERGRQSQDSAETVRPSAASSVGYATMQGLQERASEALLRKETRLVDQRSSAVGGFWRDADWIYCRDEKYRAVEPGTFPLAHGSPARVGRLRGYGNALVAAVATAFIEAFLETEKDTIG